MHAVMPWLKSNVWVWPLSIVIGIFFVQVLTLSGLYADGSYMLAWIRHYHWFAGGGIGLNQPRSFMYLATEWPTVLALRLGISNPMAIAYIQSFGQYAVPAAAWSIAFWRARNTQALWFGLLLFALWLNVTFGLFEATGAYALAGASATLLFKLDWTRVDTVLLCGMAILLTMSYEAVCLITPALAYLAWRKSRIASSLFTIASVVMLWYALHPTIAANAASARDFNLWLHHFQLIITVLAIALILNGQKLAALAGICVLALPPIWAEPWADGHIRLAVALPILGAILYYMRFKPRISPALAIGLALALSVRGTYHALQFKEFVDDYRYALENVPPGNKIDELVLLRSNDYQWSWTQPVMSVDLRPEGSDYMILNGKKYHGEMDADFKKLGVIR